jgi:antitoxin VapB
MMNIIKLLQDGKNGAVILIKRFSFVKKLDPNGLILLNNNPWRPLIDSLPLFSDDFLQEREQPSIHERESTFD